MKRHLVRCCLGVGTVFMFLSMNGAAFSATINGTVMAPMGVGNIAGATVRLLGTTTIDTTDVNGLFSLAG